MSFLSDYAAAIEQYLDANVNIEILNVTYPGDRLNTGEQGTFDVLITNHGPLRMKNVKLLVRGRNGVLVKHQGALSEFETSMTISNDIDVPANGGTFLIADDSPDWNQKLYYVAPDDPITQQRPLIEVSIEDWAADFTSIHRRSSQSGAATTYVGRVRAA